MSDIEIQKHQLDLKKFELEKKKFRISLSTAIAAFISIFVGLVFNACQISESRQAAKTQFESEVALKIFGQDQENKEGLLFDIEKYGDFNKEFVEKISKVVKAGQSKIEKITEKKSIYQILMLIIFQEFLI